VSCGDYASGTNHVQNLLFLTDNRHCQHMDMRRCTVALIPRVSRNILRAKS
jgi:hypothetical protein